MPHLLLFWEYELVLLNLQTLLIFQQFQNFPSCKELILNMISIMSSCTNFEYDQYYVFLYKIWGCIYIWQGVSRALVENSRTLRIPTHLHERLSLIRNAKAKLEEKGITPSVDVSRLRCYFWSLTLILILTQTEASISYSYKWKSKFMIPYLPHGHILTIRSILQRIAECLSMSQKKVRNATEVLLGS